MPPDLPNEQELILKKRARRRLVGAVALVLLMIIVLPIILQDREALTEQEAIKITMPENSLQEDFTSSVVPVSPATPVMTGVNNTTEQVNKGKAVLPKEVEKPAPAQVESKKVSETPKATIAETKKADVPKKTEEPAKDEVPAKVETPAKTQKVEAPKSENKTSETFEIQVGVFSDMANVKQLQEKLKAAGFTSSTEKISTPKGEKIRLRAGSFKSREDATGALAKLKDAGLSGMVVAK